MKIYSADKTPLNIIRIISALITIVFLIICRYFIPFYMIMISMMFIFSASGIIMIFFYFPAMFRNMEFCIGNNEIKKKNGVFFRREQTVNISSVQYITTVCCVFRRLEGFNFIILNIYGGIMILPFLSNNTFREITSEINSTVRGD
ncbi:MAG: PH domain-containing protein [Oscillospiraceae bacterium]|nr:PH domain-containing protein [Oscillospiraceae bacterium]